MRSVYVPKTFVAMGLSEQTSSTSFKKCKGGSLAGTAHKRHTMPKNKFVKPSKDNPTIPIRTNCRASLGGVARSLQKDMSGAKESVVKRTLHRINQEGGGTRGKARFKAWGTGVGGKRMKTYHGPPHKSKRTGSLAKRLGISRKAASKLHGVSTGKADMVKHTAPYSPVGGSKGSSGNREVSRSPKADAKPKHKKSKRSKRRRASSQAVTIGRGRARAGA